VTISRRPSKYSGKRGAGAPAERRRPGGGSRPAAATAERGFILTVVAGMNPGKEFFFEQAATIGRVENNDVVLVEPGVSRNHARVRDEMGVFLLEDMGSANGTRLNGEVVKEPEVLRDGDYITLGSSTLQFSMLAGTRGEQTAQTSLSAAEAQAADRVTKTETKAGAGFVRRRWLLVVLLVLVLGGGAAAGYVMIAKRDRLVVFDRSATPLTYTDDDAFLSGVYGYGKYDKSHLSQVAVNFEYLTGRATLQYGAWGVDKSGELEILLNGERVGAAPLTMNRWIYGTKLVLPREKLKKNQTNQVVFRNTLNPGAKESWEVCYVQIIQEAIPPPDPKEARFQFELAKKAWEDREIEPSNMATALVGFKKARDLLEYASQRGELYQEALDLIDKVDAELTRKFADGLFSAKRAEKLDGDPARARVLLLGTLKYFRKDDFRYREIQRYLDSLAESK
jgi:pSer/pThr/pTyr-binding forkhead associated (FHA) protein